MVQLFFILYSLFFIHYSPVYASTTLYFGSIERTYDDSGAVIFEKRYYLAGSAVALRTKNMEQETENMSYLHADHLGSTVLVTDSTGNKSEEYVYYPYGNQNSEIRNQDQTATDKLYTGQRKDYSTDLYFYNARYYNPITGHFISADKAEGPNRYAYVGNNPIMRNDPGGNVFCKGEQCNRMFPGLKEAQEQYPVTSYSPRNFGESLGSGLANLANILGFGSMLPEEYKQYVSSENAQNALVAGAIPQPAAMTFNLGTLFQKGARVTHAEAGQKLIRRVFSAAKQNPSLTEFGSAFRTGNVKKAEQIVQKTLGLKGGRLLEVSDHLALGIENPETLAEAQRLGIRLPPYESLNWARVVDNNIIVGSTVKKTGSYLGELAHEFTCYMLANEMRVPRSDWNVTGGGMSSLNRYIESAVRSDKWDDMLQIALNMAEYFQNLK